MISNVARDDCREAAGYLVGTTSAVAKDTQPKSKKTSRVLDDSFLFVIFGRCEAAFALARDKE